MSVSSSKSGFYSGMFIIVLIAAVLNSLSLIYVNFILALPAISLILFLHVKILSGKQSFYAGALFGGLSSLILNYWMVPVVANYAKGNILLGLLCYFASAVVLGVFFGTQFYINKLLAYQESKRFSLLLNSLITASVWVLFELIRSKLFSAMPWLSYTIGITQGRSEYLIQSSAFGGVFILSFIILLTACFVAYAFINKKWKLLYIPIGIIALQYTAGYYLYKDHQTRDTKINKLSVALVMPGLSPEMVWNEESAFGLVSHLFELNNRAAASKPDLIVWTETVVPWTYAPDDDFIKEIAKVTQPSNVYSFMGMNRALSAAGTLSNSVYLLDPAGRETGRYDKQDLLSLVEKPLLSQKDGLILPFLKSFDLQMVSGNAKGPVKTPWGEAGIMLCNESTNPTIAADLVKEGAGYLVNIGNDNWFSDHFITRQHFYNCRLRAVENRKDLIINNNRGICGLVRASGEIVVQADGKESNILTGEVYPNHLTTPGSGFLIAVIACILLFAIFNVCTNFYLNK